MPRDQSGYLPASCLITCQSVWNDTAPIDSTTPAPYEITVNLSDVASQVVGLPPSGTQPAGVPGIKKVIHDTAPALFDNTHKLTPTNDAALQLLAKRIAIDFYSWRLLAYDRTLAGIVAWQPDGVAEISWRYVDDGADAGPGRAYHTRAMGWPRGDEPEEFQHVDLVDPTLPGFFYHAKTGSGGIGAASSVTQMTGGTVTIYKENYAGALTVLNDVYGNPVTVKAWNKATGGAVPPNTHIGITKDSPTGKFIVTLVAC